MPVERLRYVAFSHFEADECGVAERLARRRASRRAGVQRRSAAMVSVERRRRPPGARPRRRRGRCALGRHACAGSTRRTCRTAGSAGFMMETRDPHPALRRPLHPGRRRRRAAHRGRHPRPERGLPRADGLLRPRPADRRDPRAPRRASSRSDLACMHGSAWRGDGAHLIRALEEILTPPGTSV